tara:strand:+ start:1105 stop:1542 length:438 start_codon:yes stop_codon:yes gene_type:complete
MMSDKDIKEFHKLMNKLQQQKVKDKVKLFVYGTLKEGFGLNHILSKSKKIGTYITKRKGLMMTGFWFPYVWEKRNSQYHIKGELYEVDDEDFKKANQIELNAGYKLKEIDKGIFGYIYPKRVDIKSTMVNTNAKKKYYEWRHEED